MEPLSDLTLSHSNTELITGDSDIIPDSQPDNFDERCTFLTQDVGDENTAASVENVLLDLDSQNNFEPEASTSKGSTNSISSPLLTNSDSGVDADQLLSLLQTNFGRLIIEKRSLDKFERTTLRTMVAAEILALYPKTVPHEVYKSWTLQICAVFPREKPEHWYNPGGTDAFGTYYASGSLVNRIHNSKYKKRKTTSSDAVSVPKKPAQPQPPVDITTDEQQILSNLGQEQAPTNSVLLTFSETYDARQKLLRQLTISEYVSKFPVYHHKDGYKIILNDFRKRYPQQSGNLLDKWGAWADEIIRVANERKLVERIPFAGAERKLRAAILLPYLFPSIFISTPTGEKRCKPPRADIQKSFILLCKETDLLEQIIALRERNYIQHQTLQPFLIVVGKLESPTAYYVYIDRRNGTEDFKYCFTDFVSALDLCFKSFFVFNAEYPVCARRVWLLLQRNAYGIKLSIDRNLHQLAGVLSDLNVEAVG